MNMSVVRSVNPVTGTVIAQYPLLNDGELEARLALSVKGFGAWRDTTIEQRGVVLERMASIFESRIDALSEMIVAEVGKTLASAQGEVRKCAYTLRYYAQNAGTLLADKPASLPGYGSATVRSLPLGTILAIMPWNFPLFQAIRWLAPTLAGGNACLLKHAENVPGAALALECIGRDAGLPEGVFQSLFIDIPTVAKVIADPRVAAVTLTGSERAGRSVATEAGKVLKKCVLELGGSDPCIIMPTADLDAAAKAAVTSRMMNNGQSCICSKRFIVLDEVYDAVLPRILDLMKALHVGDPSDPRTNLGPLVSERAREILGKQVSDAVAAGGELLVGGRAVEGAGWFFEPTLIADVPEGAPIRREEFFGPVAMIFRADDRDHALAIANETPFGLGSSVWTTDLNDMAYFSSRIEAGMTFFNAMVASDPHVPFGGVKNSGFGREFGDYGIHEFLNIKTVVAS